MNVFKKILHKVIHMWDDYDKVSDIFEEPESNFYFGKWNNYQGLPVWRRGLIIHIGKYGQYHDEPGDNWYSAWAKHQVWDEKYLETCSKFGRWWRSFIKPVYQLPDLFSFHYINYRAMMKTKYDSWRYEYPPCFCIVAFNICFAWWLTAPKASTDHRPGSNMSYCDNDSYWESMLEYMSHKDECGSFSGFMKKYIGVYSTTVYSKKENNRLEKIYEENRAKKYKYGTPEYEGWRHRSRAIKGVTCYWVSLRPEYIKKEYLEEYRKGVDLIKESKMFYGKHFIFD